MDGCHTSLPVRLRRVPEIRVVVPDEVAERLANEAAERGTSADDVAAEVLTEHANRQTAPAVYRVRAQRATLCRSSAN
jgi:hypothetical protein